MGKLDGRNLDSPDEVRSFPNGKAELAKFDEHTVGRFSFEPGWRWSESVKPIVKTDLCQVHHVGYVLEGRLHVEVGDGTSTELSAGHAYDVPPGHDAWVVGDQRFVGLEFLGAAVYAKPK